MTRAELREAVYDLLDWHPDPTDNANEGTNRDIARALSEMVRDHPGRFNEETFKTAIHAPYSVPSGSTLSVLGTDSLVLTRALSTDYPLEYTGLWRGWTIELKEPVTGQWVRRTIRDIFVSGFSDMIVIDVPWRNTTDTGIEYRIYQPYIWLPDDIEHVRDVTARDFDNGSWPMKILPQETAYRQERHENLSNQYAGYPYTLFRDTHYHLPAPKEAPAVAVASTPENYFQYAPVGTRKYRYTYCFGYHDTRIRSVRGLRDPLFESAPSPASAEASIALAGSQVGVTINPLDYWLGYADAPTKLSYMRSGVKVRIYCAQTSVTAGTSDPYKHVEADEQYYLIAEHDPQTDGVGFNDRGHVLDRTRPLRSNGSYTGFFLDPLPQETYPTDVRCVRQPLALVDDQALLPLPRAHCELLAKLAAAYKARAIGQQSLYAQLLASYKEGVSTSKKSVVLPTSTRKKYARI